MGGKETAVAFEAGEGLKDEMCLGGDLTSLGQGPDLGSERGHVRPFRRQALPKKENVEPLDGSRYIPSIG